MIEGVKVKDLKVFQDDRGYLMEIVRKDDKVFQKFGQVYVSSTIPNVVKAWHLHKKQWDHICCLVGSIKLAIYDERPNSKTKGDLNQFFIGENNPKVVVVPAGTWHGWKGISLQAALVLNTVSEVYNPKKPDEKRIDPHDNHIPFDWTLKDG